MIPLVTQFSYLVATVFFILSLKWMSHPRTARSGLVSGFVAMLVAIGGTLLSSAIIGYTWIAVGIGLGVFIGVPLSRVPLTAVPQRTALSHAFGGLATTSVGIAEYYVWLGDGELSSFRVVALSLEVILGALTFSGSLLAAGKLQEIIQSRPITYRGQNFVNISILALAIVLSTYLAFYPATAFIFPMITILSLLFGALLILPIGGADMPTVIALLNSYAGLSAVAMGFALENSLLIAAGALDGASGLILSIVMCKAMNRSFRNVIFGAFGTVSSQVSTAETKTAKSLDPLEASQLLEIATTVVVIPGYGMAVAQAQHRLRDLYQELSKRGVNVKFAIHPVAGRMPGHMNVLLAEAEIPYEVLFEMDEINPELPQTDIALVIGANDVVNPAARSNPTSPIYGMPIIEADRARSVMAIKRTLNPGFAGIENELYYNENTSMLFGDAKAVLNDLVKGLA